MSTSAGLVYFPIQITGGDYVQVAGDGYPYVVSVVDLPELVRIERMVGITDAGGLVTFNWSPPFDATPIISTALQGGGGFYSTKVITNSSSFTTVEVTQAAGITLLGIGVLAAASPANAIPVMVTAVQPPGV